MDKEDFIRALAAHAAITSRIWEQAEFKERADAFCEVIKAYVEGSIESVDAQLHAASESHLATSQ